MRKIGLDVGDKTIGVAVSDELDITAQGITTIERVGIKKDNGKVLEYIKEYGNRWRHRLIDLCSNCCFTVIYRYKSKDRRGGQEDL